MVEKLVSALFEFGVHLLNWNAAASSGEPDAPTAELRAAETLTLIRKLFETLGAALGVTTDPRTQRLAREVAVAGAAAAGHRRAAEATPG